MMLLDSNILIYASKAEGLDNPVGMVMQQDALAISDITRLEVLGYHGLKGTEEADLGQMIQRMQVVPVDGQIIDMAIGLRQQKSISLGDAIIAATALELDLTLVTRNSKDFEWIDGLEVVNPFATPSM